MHKSGVDEMENNINMPVETEWTDADIVSDFKLYNDKKIVAKRYCITVKEVTEILKRCPDV